MAIIRRNTNAENHFVSAPLMLIAVAAFNLVSNLIMIVNERKADIAIFRTMGASRAEILRIFLWHGFMIGLVGIAAGLIIGSLLATFITPIYGAMDRSFNFRTYGRILHSLLAFSNTGVGSRHDWWGCGVYMFAGGNLSSTSGGTNATGGALRHE